MADELIMVNVMSLTYNRLVSLPAFLKNGMLVLTHAGIKNFVLNAMMAQSLNKKDWPITYSYESVKVSDAQCVVNCTFSYGNYTVTETGETGARTLYTDVAKNYPYLEAQKRAFDRAAISFFQFQVDGRQVYSDSEIK